MYAIFNYNGNLRTAHQTKKEEDVIAEMRIFKKEGTRAEKADTRHLMTLEEKKALQIPLGSNRDPKYR